MYAEAIVSSAPKPPESPFRKFTLMVKDAIFLASVIVALSSAVGGLVIKLAWPVFVAQLAEDLNVITRDDLIGIQEQLDKATGDDRLIRMPSGHSYIQEPVSVGDEIIMTLVMGRTSRGLACNFSGAIPLFMDARGIPIAGETLPTIKQLSTVPERLLLTLGLPPSLEPGRVQVTLAMKYLCPFGISGTYIDVYDETDAVFFQLDP